MAWLQPLGNSASPLLCGQPIVCVGLEAAAAARYEQRPVWGGGPLLPSAKGSDVDLLGDARRVIEFHAEVSNRAVHLCVAEQELNRTQISRVPVD